MWAKIGIVLVLIILLLVFAPSAMYVAAGGVAIVGGLAFGQATGLWSGGDDDMEIYDGGVHPMVTTGMRNAAWNLVHGVQPPPQPRQVIPGAPNFAANQAAVAAALVPGAPGMGAPPRAAAAPAPAAAFAPPLPPMPAPAPAPAPPVPAPVPPVPAPVPPVPAPVPPVPAPVPAAPAPVPAAPAPALRDLTQERAAAEAAAAMRVYNSSAYAISV